jgi:hypothetical protein
VPSSVKQTRQIFLQPLEAKYCIFLFLFAFIIVAWPLHFEVIPTAVYLSVLTEKWNSDSEHVYFQFFL